MNTLYELHGYRTKHYDRKSEKTIRLKEEHGRPLRVNAWIENFLREYPDGKVVVSRVETERWVRNQHLRIKKVKKAFVQTAEGRK